MELTARGIYDLMKKKKFELFSDEDYCITVEQKNEDGDETHIFLGTPDACTIRDQKLMRSSGAILSFVPELLKFLSGESACGDREALELQANIINSIQEELDLFTK